MRLNWFLPFLRKKKKNESLLPQAALLRAAQSMLPKSWFADRVTGKPGAVRKLLKRLGPSVLSSPVRRLVQAVCFLLFLVLFFYVCWPYSAKPAEVGRTSTGWQFVEIDQQSGELRFSIITKPDWLVDQQVVYIANGDSNANYIGAFRVAETTASDALVSPVAELSPEVFDQLLLSQAVWSFSESQPDRWPSHYADDLARKEMVAAELFLAIDPLVSLSTAIASRSWVWSLTSAAIILLVCVVIPRGFCGYLCPLGTMIDIFDWLIGRRVIRFRVPADGWWVHIKYYLLAGTLVAAVFGVLVSGFVAAIPVITRGMLLIGEPLQSGMSRGWHLIPMMHAGHFFSIALFAGVLFLGFFQPRFWCKYVCPSGAVFSLGNLFRVSERKVESTCINCNKCVEICPFDAIKPDFTTRTTDCTLCQTCGGVCPTQAIKFVDRWDFVELKVLNDPPTGETAIGRRGFLSLAAGSAAAITGGATAAIATRTFGAKLEDPTAFRPVRPPGSVPEQQFLEMCIRCGECFKACPNNVLQLEGFEQGLEGLWTPMVKADWAGCESSCNACGQVCPTGAIRALPLEEKKVARMGLAIVNEATCLPLANREACQLCVDECNAAGYEAIEFINVHTELDDNGVPIDGSSFVAPVVLADKCVGCGLCQTRCYAINVKEKHLLDASAIIIKAGPGREDRMMTGSYLRLRDEERESSAAAFRESSGDFFVPSEVSPNPLPAESDQPSGVLDDDPFGLGK